jgi:hypothetical protein
MAQGAHIRRWPVSAGMVLELALLVEVQRLWQTIPETR